MLKVRSLLLISAIILLTTLSMAQPQDQNAYYVPDGMELMKLEGGSSVIVPKGAKVRKEAGQTFIESNSEYMARKFTEIESRLATIEKNQEDLKKTVEVLIKIFEGMSKPTAFPAGDATPKP